MKTIIRQTTKEEKKVSKIIDRVLKQVFGEQATTIIYRYLENNYSLDQNEIADDIDKFAKGLEAFLKSGAYAIEHRILEDIYSNYGLLRRLELERTQEEHDFASKVKLIMQKA